MIKKEEDYERFPEPDDRSRVVNYCVKTGRIQQCVTGSLADAHRHHRTFPDHDYIEIASGTVVDVENQMVDLKTLTLVPRVYTLADARSKAERLVESHYHMAVDSAWTAVAHSKAADPMAEFQAAKAAHVARRAAVLEKIKQGSDPVAILAIKF